MKLNLFSALAILLFSANSLGAEAQQKFTKNHDLFRVNSWVLEENKSLQLCREFEGYLNQFPNAFMNKEFEPHKYIKEVKIPRRTEVSEAEFLVVLKQLYDKYVTANSARKTFEEKVEAHRKYNASYFSFHADINHDGNIEKVFWNDTYYLSTYYKRVNKKLEKVFVDMPSYGGYVVTDNNQLNTAFADQAPVKGGWPFFYRGRFYLYSQVLSASFVDEPYVLENTSYRNPLKNKQICVFKPQRK